MKSALRIASTAVGLALLCALAWLAGGLRTDKQVGEPRAPASAQDSPPSAADIEVPALHVNDDPESRIALGAPAFEPAAQRALAASGAKLAIFRGRLVYDSTGQGVPWFGVMLHGVELQDLYCTTDQDGRFQSPYALPLERTLVRPTDQRTTYSPGTKGLAIQRENGDSEVTIRVRAAPTIAILGEFPEGVDPATFQASVDVGGGMNAVAEDRLRLCGTQWFIRPRGDDVMPSQDTSERALDQEQSAPDEWRIPHQLRLVNEDGTLLGSAQHDVLEGVIAVTPQWQVRGAFEVSFRGNWNVAPAWPVAVELLGAQADAEPIESWGTLDRFAKEPLRFSGLAPGAYTLSVSGQGFTAVELPVVARSGVLSQVEVRLECLAVAGSIRGEIVSESGTAPEFSEFAHVSLAGSNWETDAKLNLDQKSTGWKAHFEFKDVPAGEFQLSCPFLKFGLVSSHTAGCRAGDSVRLLVLDRPAYVDLGFRVFDSDSGVELKSYSASVTWSMHSQERRGLPSGAIAATALPETGLFSWELSSPGYLCAQGVINGPSAWSVADGAKRWIDVRLQRGWSVLVWALDSESKIVLTGASILVDGVAHAVTDEYGQFTLTLPERPRSIDVRYKDWICTERPHSLEQLDSCETAGFKFRRP
jgi:hypothetical protein